MKRREFIILSSIGATSSTLLSACGHPEEKLIPAFIPDDEYVPGIDYWKASTCGMCPAGCGIIVRTREHKANKIEGNPLHPVNRGALCARGQAGLQVLYNPDRIKGPLKRVGERGEGKWEEISWDEAFKILAEKLLEIRTKQRDDGTLIFAMRETEGVTGLAARIFGSAYGSRIYFSGESTVEDIEREAYRQSYGRRVRPVFDLANASYLISFSARFLETWHSPTMYSLAYGEFRQAKGKPRGKFVQVEPRLSLTAANADEWLPARLGSGGLVALAMAQVMIREGLVDNPASPEFLTEPLEAYAPEKTAERTDIPAERITRVAREFASSLRPLAIGSSEVLDGALDTHLIAINFLNKLVGNLNKPGGVVLPEYDFNPLSELTDVEMIRWNSSLNWSVTSEEIHALLIHKVNPVYYSRSWQDVMKRIPFVASFSAFMDETTQLADLILPDHTYLESWDLKTTPLDERNGALTIQQPVVIPEFNTRQTADVLLALSRELSAESAIRSPFSSAEGVVKEAVGRLVKSTEATVTPNAQRTEGLKTALDRAVWVGALAKSGETFRQTLSKFSLLSPKRDRTDDEDQYDQYDSNEYPLALLDYEHAMLGYGEHSNLALLQETPDTMTSVMWGSWVEINPGTAASLGIANGDLVKIQTPFQTSDREMLDVEKGVIDAVSPEDEVILPALLYEAIRPDVIAVPFGQGHTAYGRYAQQRGANPILLKNYLRVPQVRSRTIPVKLTKVSGGKKLIRFGTDLQQRMENKR